MLTYFFAAVIAVSALFAQQKNAPADKFEGKIAAVGDGKVTLMQKKDGEKLDFAVNSSTVITRQGKPAQLKDLMLEDKAEITATGEAKNLTAKTITALAPE